MRSKAVQPEILPPLSASDRQAPSLDDESLAYLASLLDDRFQIPGTTIRFGLDALIGLVPGFGDLISSLASFIIIFAAWQRGLPQVTVGRMVANVAIDTLVGAVPFMGDMFDVAWKANRKNFNLLQRASGRASRRQSWRDWLFLAGLALALAALIAVPLLALWLIVQAVRR
jgi:Domain of unknown function (DUF4112)